MLPPALIYLHGFLSGPESTKARQTVAYFASHHPKIEVFCPQLPADFDRWPGFIADIIATYKHRQVAIIGSSLGGYLATYLADKLQCAAAVINPAVRPDELLQDFLGTHQCYYSEQLVEVKTEHLPLLRSLYCPDPPVKIRVLLQTGDETLDYRQALDYFENADLVVEHGGDHSFQNYQQHLPALAQYLFSSR